MKVKKRNLPKQKDFISINKMQSSQKPQQKQQKLKEKKLLHKKMFLKQLKLQALKLEHEIKTESLELKSCTPETSIMTQKAQKGKKYSRFEHSPKPQRRSRLKHRNSIVSSKSNTSSFVTTATKVEFKLKMEGNSEERKRKQSYLKREILDANYDIGEFAEFMMGQKPDGLNVDNWEETELMMVVDEFVRTHTPLPVEYDEGYGEESPHESQDVSPANGHGEYLDTEEIEGDMYPDDGSQEPQSQIDSYEEDRY